MLIGLDPISGGEKWEKFYRVESLAICVGQCAREIDESVSRDRFSSETDESTSDSSSNTSIFSPSSSNLLSLKLNPKLIQLATTTKLSNSRTKPARQNEKIDCKNCLVTSVMLLTTKPLWLFLHGCYTSCVAFISPSHVIAVQ
jgi:hypothetical protein